MVTIWVMKPQYDFMDEYGVEIEYTRYEVMKAAAFAAGVHSDNNWEEEVLLIYKEPFHLEIITDDPIELIRIGMSIQADTIHNIDPCLVRQVETLGGTQ